MDTSHSLPVPIQTRGVAAAKYARAKAPIVGWDVGRGIAKVNPLATWTHDDIESYVRDRGLPEHPLRAKGYPSIGCWPCTRSVQEGEDERAGRWAGKVKKECGLHVIEHQDGSGI